MGIKVAKDLTNKNDTCYFSHYNSWIITSSDRRPETKQGIEGKIVRFRTGMVRDRIRVRDN